MTETKVVEGEIEMFNTGYYGDFATFEECMSSEDCRLTQAFKQFEGKRVRVTIEELP